MSLQTHLDTTLPTPHVLTRPRIDDPVRVLAKLRDLAEVRRHGPGVVEGVDHGYHHAFGGLPGPELGGMGGVIRPVGVDALCYLVSWCINARALVLHTHL